ncbi:leader peptidase (prepilin peptidase) / N-methyltransferase [Evansella caseinilytica]|uniref:Leader peptidase (Prepilin peptidase) / N-methyltransferase n=1 Tax=Evansella caseinilytica TaxID=1503961 RepID=A0A1H3PTG9_9BACI|nr:A24 family peptidase [Evansella caseinilytica]SDZ04165.1 leader peptidase (prepilin peptidase) / N-methyltransferase [Evansella caseinilytica]
MELLLSSYLFVLGACLGSFYNVVGLRVPAGESVVRPRSRCPQCRHTLSWLELIPVLSFIWQKGRCRSCRTTISPLYPFIELTTACLFTISPMLVGWSKELPVALAFLSLLIIITVSDMKTMLIPDKVLLVFTGIFAALRFLSPLTPWWDSLLGAAAGFGILLLLAVISKGGMGGGDIKLFGVIGIILGFNGVIIALFLASFIGAAVGGAALIRKKATRKTPIPFGPFIAVGAVASYFFHEQLLEWYLHFISF